MSRWVDQRGKISLAGFTYRTGPTFAGEPVEVICHGGLVEILHAGVVVDPTPNGFVLPIPGRQLERPTQLPGRAGSAGVVGAGGGASG